MGLEAGLRLALSQHKLIHKFISSLSGLKSNQPQTLFVLEVGIIERLGLPGVVMGTSLLVFCCKKNQKKKLLKKPGRKG